MKKQSNAYGNVKSESDVLKDLITLLEDEGDIKDMPSLHEIYDQLYRSLYNLRDFSPDLEVQKGNIFKKNILRLYRRIWRIGASPYIRYHNQFHATLINIIFIQNAIIKEQETRINQRTIEE